MRSVFSRHNSLVLSLWLKMGGIPRRKIVRAGITVWLHAACLMGILAVVHTEPAQLAKAIETPQELLQRLASLLPAQNGWRLAAQPQIVVGEVAYELWPENIRAHILEYGLQWAVCLSIQPKTPPEPLKIELLKFREALASYGAFSRFRSPEAAAANYKSLSYWKGDELHIWRDDFYIRILPAQASPAHRAAVGAAAEALLSVMPEPAQWPLMLRLMPQGRLVANSLRYYRHRLPLDLPLEDGLSGLYLENGTSLQLILIRCENEAEAQQCYQKIIDQLEKKETAKAVPMIGRQAHLLYSTQYGLVYLIQEKNYLALALNVHSPQTAESLLRILATNIRIMR